MSELFNTDDSAGLPGSHEPGTAATARQRLPADSSKACLKKGAHMSMYQFDTEEAVIYGVDGAVMLQNLKFWIAKNKANDKHFYDGRYWTYNTVSAFSELFIFWSEGQIRRILDRLESDGAIISGNYNRVSYDRTKWYSVNEESISQKRKIHLMKSTNGFDGNDKPIPDINTDSKTQINKSANANTHPPEWGAAPATPSPEIRSLEEKESRSPNPPVPPAPLSPAQERRKLALELERTLVDTQSRARGRKLTTRPTGKGIDTLLGMGVKESHIRAAIEYLATDENINDQFGYRVDSGRSLREKYDRIVEKAKRSKWYKSKKTKTEVNHVSVDQERLKELKEMENGNL